MLNAWTQSDALLERLETPFHVADALERNYFIELPIDVAHAVAAGELPRYHEDPFDRILVAQARTRVDDRRRRRDVSERWPRRSSTSPLRGLTG